LADPTVDVLNRPVDCRSCRREREFFRQRG
jgi:hypothetical protein